MRKSIFIDKGKLGEMKYKGSPLRQILALSISAEHQLLLLNFFSHSDVWQLSLNSIANHSFGIKKNRDRVKKSLEQLEGLGLITITNNIYAPNLDNIQKQYLASLEAKKVLKTDTQSITNITDTQSITLPDTESINDTQSITLPDTQSITLPDTQSITNTDTQSITLPDTQSITNINKELKEEKIKEDKIEMKQAKGSFSDLHNFSLSDFSNYIPKYIASVYKKDFIEDYKEFSKVNSNTSITIQQYEEFQVFCIYIEEVKKGLSLVDNKHFNTLLQESGLYEIPLSKIGEDVKKEIYLNFKSDVLPKLLR